MRAPDAPIGWPSAQAPPFTLDLLVRQIEIVHRCHRDNREGLVDLVEIDLALLPVDAVEQLADGAHRRRGEPGRRLREGRMAANDRERLQAAPIRLAPDASGTRAAAPSEIEEELAAVTVPLSRKAGFQRRQLLGLRLARLLVVLDTCDAATTRDLDGDRLAGERTAVDCRIGALQRG